MQGGRQRTFVHGLAAIAGLGVLAFVWILRGGPATSQVAAGVLTTTSGQTVSVTRASSKTCGTYPDTQIIVNPERLDLTPWTKGFCCGASAAPVVTADATVDPFGFTTADALAFPSISSGATSANQDFDTDGVSAYTFSAYVKAASGTGTIYVFMDGLYNSALTWWTTPCAVNSTTWTRCSVTTPVLPSGVAQYHAFVGYDTRDAQQTVFPIGAATYYVANTKLEKGTTASAYYAYGNNGGSIRTLGNNTPCVETQGLLVEKATTNYVPQSQNLSNASWIKRGTSVAASTHPAPDGTMTAYTVSGLNAAGSADLYTSIPSGIPVGPIALSFYLYKTTSTGTLRVNSATAAPGSWDINLSLVPANAWTRITSSHAAVTVNTAFSTADGSGGPLFSASVGGPLTVDLWGIQEEANNYPTSYIPTTGTAATRTAEYAQVQASAMSGSDFCFSADIQPIGGTAWNRGNGGVYMIFGGPTSAAGSQSNNGSWALYPSLGDTNPYIATKNAAGTQTALCQHTAQVFANGSAHHFRVCQSGNTFPTLEIDGATVSQIGGTCNVPLDAVPSYLTLGSTSYDQGEWLNKVCYGKDKAACP